MARMAIILPLAKPSCFFIACILCTHFFLVSIAQSQPSPAFSLNQNQGISNEQPPMNQGTVMVDPNTYLIGSGDEFEIKSSKVATLSYTGIVNEKGILFIPELGTFKLGRIPLNQALDKIKDEISRNSNALGDVFVTLSNIKNISLVISGSGVASGTYRLPGNLRILDALRIANNDSLPDLITVDLRNVKVIGQDTFFTVDLLKFIATGSLKDNPYVYPGFDIHLSFISEYVMISGDIQSPLPQKIPLRSNESIADILALFTFGPTADSMTITLQRQGQSPYLFQKNVFGTVALQHLDCIIVSSRQDKKHLFSIKVSGEVQKPGMYSIDSGHNTARTILQYAGGATQRADTNRLYIIRRKMVTTLSNNYFGSELSSIRQPITIAAKKMIHSHDCTIIPLNQRELSLIEEDELVVPQKQTSIYVSGSVASPGVYEYAEDESIEYYLSQAGGITRSGDNGNVRVISVYGDVYQVNEDKNIEPGDILLVPEKEQNQWVKEWAPVIQLVGTTLGVFISAISLYTLYNNDK